MISRAFLVIAAACAVCACKQGAPAGTLVGDYDVRGVLVENTCGQAALPTTNPLQFNVELREDQGVGYWVPSKMAQNTGSLSVDGAFRFAVSTTQQVSQTTQANNNLQPSDFRTLDPDFDLKKATCALTTMQTVTGALRRRLAADGGVVDTGNTADAAATATDDLTAEHLIVVSPTTGSDCNAVLTTFGGNFQNLPCQARYELTGKLIGAAASNSNAGASATP
jgi:hypothetical protein